MLPEGRRPIHPGEIIKFTYLKPLKLSTQQLADALNITANDINDILHGKKSITPDLAFRLAKCFQTTPDFWINLQIHVDMWETLQAHKQEYDKIHRLS